MPKLILENFGPIKEHTEIEIKDFMVFTGEQASGKSTIAKAMWRCLYKRNKEKVKEMEISELLSLYGEDIKAQLGIPPKAYFEGQPFEEEPLWPPLYIPAERNLFTALAQQMESFLLNLSDAQKQAIDHPTYEYIKFVSSIKYSFQEGIDNLKIASSTKELVHRLMKGKYYSMPDRFVVNNDTSLPLNQISSGQQSLLWLINLLLLGLEEKKQQFIFIIEEPESNLFPESQKLLMELLALMHNAGHQILITTHSPYILSSLNNLLYAHQCGQKNEEAVNKIVNKASWLDKEKFGAWYVADGTAKDCFDKEMGIIEDKFIDSISTVINKEFDQLLEVNQNG